MLSPLEVFWEDIIVASRNGQRYVNISLLFERYEELMHFWKERKKDMSYPKFEENVLHAIGIAQEKIIVWWIAYKISEKVLQRTPIPDRIKNISKLPYFRYWVIDQITKVLFSEKDILPATYASGVYVSQNISKKLTHINVPQIQQELLLKQRTIMEILIDDGKLWSLENISFQISPDIFVPLENEEIDMFLNYCTERIITALENIDDHLYFVLILYYHLITTKPELEWLSYLNPKYKREYWTVL